MIIIRWSSVSTILKSVLAPSFTGNCDQLGKLKLMCQPRHHTGKLLSEKQNKRNLSNEDDVFLKMRLMKSKKFNKYKIMLKENVCKNSVVFLNHKF